MDIDSEHLGIPVRKLWYILLLVRESEKLWQGFAKVDTEAFLSLRLLFLTILINLKSVNNLFIYLLSLLLWNQFDKCWPFQLLYILPSESSKLQQDICFKEEYLSNLTLGYWRASSNSIIPLIKTNWENLWTCLDNSSCILAFNRMAKASCLFLDTKWKGIVGTWCLCKWTVCDICIDCHWDYLVEENLSCSMWHLITFCLGPGIWCCCDNAIIWIPKNMSRPDTDWWFSDNKLY